MCFYKYDFSQYRLRTFRIKTPLSSVVQSERKSWVTFFFRRSTLIKSRALDGGGKREGEKKREKKNKNLFCTDRRRLCIERIRQQIVGSSFTWNFFARPPDRFKASIRGHLRRPKRGSPCMHMHMHVHDAYGSRAGSRRNGERIIESGEMILLLYVTHCAPIFLLSLLGETDFHAINDSYLSVTSMLIFLINSPSHRRHVWSLCNNWTANYGWDTCTNFVWSTYINSWIACYIVLWWKKVAISG